MTAARRPFSLAMLVLPLALAVGPATGGPPSPSLPSSSLLRVTAFKASSTASFDWSCTNQPNNSGWARMEGKAEYTETLQRPSRKRMGDGALIIADKLVTGGATVRTRVSSESHSVTKTQQHEPERCDSEEPRQATLGGVQLKSTDGSHVTIKWILTTQSRCMPPAQGAEPAFITRVAVGELKRPVIHLRGHGTVPLAPGSSGGALGYKSHGSLHWQASITLKKLKPAAGGG